MLCFFGIRLLPDHFESRQHFLSVVPVMIPFVLLAILVLCDRSVLRNDAARRFVFVVIAYLGKENISGI